MAFDAFMKIDGILGESSDSQFKDWIELGNFCHSLAQLSSTTASSSGGGTSERVQHDDFKVSHYLDRASPKLMEACCSGQHFKEVAIVFCRAGGDKQKYMEIKLSQVIVSSVYISAFIVADDGNVSIKNKTMASVPAKHIGIFCEGKIWHYNNRLDEVVCDTPEKFQAPYSNKGKGGFYYGSLIV